MEGLVLTLQLPCSLCLHLHPCGPAAPAGQAPRAPVYAQVVPGGVCSGAYSTSVASQGQRHGMTSVAVPPPCSAAAARPHSWFMIHIGPPGGSPAHQRGTAGREEEEKKETDPLLGLIDGCHRGAKRASDSVGWAAIGVFPDEHQ